MKKMKKLSEIDKALIKVSKEREKEISKNSKRDKRERDKEEARSRGNKMQKNKYE